MGHPRTVSRPGCHDRVGIGAIWQTPLGEWPLVAAKREARGPAPDGIRDNDLGPPIFPFDQRSSADPFMDVLLSGGRWVGTDAGQAWLPTDDWSQRSSAAAGDPPSVLERAMTTSAPVRAAVAIRA